MKSTNQKTGSLFNHLMGQSNAIPKVGLGATVLHWTDRSAYFVDFVSTDLKTVIIERAKAVRTDKNEMSDAQAYEYLRDDNAIKTTLRFRYGSWYIDYGKGAFERYRKINIRFGFMREYYDYSF